MKQRTAEECIDALQTVADRIDGELLRSSVYQSEKDESHPSISTIANVCGSWSKAKSMAGLQTTGYTEEECITALQTAARENGPNLTISEYKTSDVDGPTVETMSNIFGSWNGAKEAAGLTANAGPGTYNEEDCVTGVVSVAERIGRIPTSKEYVKHSSGEPGYSSVVRILGSWREARIRAARKAPSLATAEYRALAWFRYEFEHTKPALTSD